MRGVVCMQHPSRLGIFCGNLQGPLTPLRDKHGTMLHTSHPHTHPSELHVTAN